MLIAMYRCHIMPNKVKQHIWYGFFIPIPRTGKTKEQGLLDLREISVFGND